MLTRVTDLLLSKFRDLADLFNTDLELTGDINPARSYVAFLRFRAPNEASAMVITSSYLITPAYSTGRGCTRFGPPLPCWVSKPSEQDVILCPW